MVLFLVEVSHQGMGYFGSVVTIATTPELAAAVVAPPEGASMGVQPGDASGRADEWAYTPAEFAALLKGITAKGEHAIRYGWFALVRHYVSGQQKPVALFRVLPVEANAPLPATRME